MSGDTNRAVSSPMVLFTRPGQVATMTLADGFRFVCLIRGEPPVALPINESGEWHIDIPALLARGKYPVGVTTIDAAHVKAFESLPADVVEEMLLAAERAGWP